MSGGGAKGGPQAGTQQAMGGGKGGPQAGINRGPGGNAQNNPGGPQANYGMGMNPGNPGLSQWASMAKTFNGLGSAGVDQMTAQPGPNMPGNPNNPTANSVGQSIGSNPGMMDWFSLAQKFPQFVGSNGPMNSTPPSFRGWGNDIMPSSPGPTPTLNQIEISPQQPYQPSTGWTGNQPSQWAAQAEAIKPPSHNAAGLPMNGILAKLFGG
jgi:hypothetical protein